ncbi:MAG: LysM peptidoglycan-binding domain-containing protein [Phenylobacterium sp.]|uniref:LysM peptidoglycan-binding domain-containing protein n=1 Tax=Phenylobacterium sp. TaxID=1871053 RepID=UPI0027326360|nr:LysM peptidoglycan-binding domain-containing protein [Phenylobacterium sp.]MDP3745786.1 LysM peptidoglycan-binding domain-containing protein [Phenylobacterium sp.]
MAGSALAACESLPQATSPNYPVRTAPPATTPAVPPPPPVVAEQAPSARPTAPVESQNLPYIAPARELPPAPAPTRPPTTRPADAGRLVETPVAAQTYTVKRGDNLAAIARTLGVSLQRLAEENDLAPPYALRPGQVLKAPLTGATATAYVVGSGDTLYAIARRFGVSPQALAEANSMGVNESLAIGRRLILPGAFVDRAPPASTVPGRRPPARIETPAAEPQRETVTVRRVTGKVVEVSGPPVSYTVKKGDNLDAIARELKTDRKQLADDNKLKAPYALQPGQKLKGPKTTAKAYVVGEDDTMALVAKRFGVTAKALAAANDMKVGATLREGRKLTLPSGYKDRGPIRETVAAPPRPEAPAPRPAAPPPAYTPPPVTPPPAAPPPVVTPQPTPPPAARPTPQPYTPLPPPPAARPTPPAATRPPTTPIVPSSGPVADSTISSLGKGRFIWPVRGDLLSDFGPKGTGQRNDGINIRAQVGEPVRAAAGGDVVYAGDQVPGFGNLVLVKHADGWVTAYGHLGRVDVKMTQDIVQGQQIGMAGSTGGVSETQVHFEVRYAPTPQDRARPIDPKLVLPR